MYIYAYIHIHITGISGDTKQSAANDKKDNNNNNNNISSKDINIKLLSTLTSFWIKDMKQILTKAFSTPKEFILQWVIERMIKAKCKAVIAHPAIANILESAVKTRCDANRRRYLRFFLVLMCVCMMCDVCVCVYVCDVCVCVYVCVCVCVCVMCVCMCDVMCVM